VQVWFTLLARLALASVFWMAALAKLPVRHKFVATVRKFKILPPVAGSVYALSLPWIEICAALLLFVGLYSQFAALTVAAVMATFLFAVASAMHRRLDVDCDCFGLLYQERTGYPTLARDVVLLSIAMLLVGFPNDSLSLSKCLDNPGYLNHAIALSLTAFAFSLSSVLGGLAVKRVRAISTLLPEPIGGLRRYIM
jgi:putative oxidoreductase